ncbi:hypothetical protein [Dyadobacter sp.]|uniref:hypothetical protein n=1 Tax=Dyadobacter sp. TaxID=1914288 RepID=UPI003F70BA57
MFVHKNVFLHEQAWTESFEGWYIVDVAVRERGFVYVILRKTIPCEKVSLTWDHDVPSRIVALYLNETDPKEKWGHQGLSGFLLTFGGACREPLPQGLALSGNGDVYATGSRKTGIEKVAPGGPGLSLSKCRCIADRAYVVGMGRTVHRRLDIGKWESLSLGLPAMKRDASANELLDLGFRDIDGFAEDDLYAVGGRGDVWHWNGKIWIPCEFPTNWPLFTVCCGGDSQVYISGEGGTLFQGRGDLWKRIWQAEYTVPYNDSRWFAGKLWLSSDYMLDEWSDNQVKHVHYDGKRVNARGHMDAGDGIIVVAGADDVRLFDGDSWHDIVVPYR